MLADKIQEAFNEPGCDHNQAKTASQRKKGCSKPLKPGAAAGGCAFDGAKIALQPIADAAHLVHGPIACEGNFWDNRGSKSSGPQLYRTGFTTDMGEFDVIYGGEKRLWKAIKEIVLKHDPPAVFVYQTCVPALIGDDVEAVCKHAREKLGRPVIPVIAPGFVGSKNLGNKLAGESEAAALLEAKTGVPTRFFERVTGLGPVDALVKALSEISGRPAPAKVRRQREQLVDAMLDGHFYFGRKRVACALEPDLLAAYVPFLDEMGCDVTAAVAPTPSPSVERLKAWTVAVGDHEDFETMASGADLLISNAHARQASERLGIPLVRAGFPTFDRLGAGLRAIAGYRGTRDLVFEIGNLFLVADHEAHADPGHVHHGHEVTHGHA